MSGWLARFLRDPACSWLSWGLKGGWMQVSHETSSGARCFQSGSKPLPAVLPQGSGSLTWEVKGRWWGPGDVRQDGVQGPGEYFGLDPWGSVQEVARPSASVSLSRRRQHQLPLVTRARFRSAFHKAQMHTCWPSPAPGARTAPKGSSACWAKTGVWSPWDPSSSVSTACSRLCGFICLVLVAVQERGG